MTKKIAEERFTDIREAARTYAEQAIEALADIAENGDSEAARVSAANSLLDRGWGKSEASMKVEATTRRDPEDYTDAELIALIEVGREDKDSE